MEYQNAADILPEDYLTEKRQAYNVSHSPQPQFHDTYNDTSDGDDNWSENEFDTDEEDHVHENGTVNGYHHDELEDEGIYDAPEQNDFKGPSVDFKGPPPVSRLSKPKPAEQKVAPVPTSHKNNPAFQVNAPTKQKQFKQFNTPAKLNGNFNTTEREPHIKPSARSPSKPNSFPKKPVLVQKPKPNPPVFPKPNITSQAESVIENLDIYEDPDNADQQEDADSFYEMPDHESESNQRTFQNTNKCRPPARHLNSNLNAPKMPGGIFMEKLNTMKQKTLDFPKKIDKKVMEIKPKPNHPPNKNIQNMNTEIKKRPAMPLPYHGSNTNNATQESYVSLTSPAKAQTSSVKGRPPCPLPTSVEHQKSLSPRPPPIGEIKIEEVVEDGEKEYSYAYPDPLPNFDRSNFEKKKDEKAGIYQPQNFITVPTVKNGSKSNSPSYIAPNISLPRQFDVPPKAPERLSDPKPLITPPAVSKPPKTKQQPMPPKILQELRQQKPNLGTPANRGPAELAPKPSALGQRVSPIGQENDSRNSGKSLNTQRQQQQQQQPPNQRFNNNRHTPPLSGLKPLPDDICQKGIKLGPGSLKSPFSVGRRSREEKPVEKSPVQLQGYPWYQGDITERVQAEDRLRGKPDGSFIIRPTNKGEGYSISLCHKGVVTHLRVPLGDGYYRLGTSEKNFTTVPELVSFYQKNAVVLQSGGKVILRR